MPTRKPASTVHLLLSCFSYPFAVDEHLHPVQGGFPSPPSSRETEVPMTHQEISPQAERTKRHKFEPRNKKRNRNGNGHSRPANHKASPVRRMTHHTISYETEPGCTTSSRTNAKSLRHPALPSRRMSILKQQHRPTKGWQRNHHP